MGPEGGADAGDYEGEDGGHGRTVVQCGRCLCGAILRCMAGMQSASGRLRRAWTKVSEDLQRLTHLDFGTKKE